MTMHPFFKVIAFSKNPLGGNPAAVVPLDEFPADQAMQALARENNLSETAYFVPTPGEDADYHLRWFTPGVEVDLCGHATLAVAHVIFETIDPVVDKVSFSTQSGVLGVARDGDRRVMDFPSRAPSEIWPPDGLLEAMGTEPRESLRGTRDFLFVYEDQAAVAALTPDFEAIKSFGHFGVIATAPGDDCDFVSRCFFPSYGLNEDPVTGSAHCTSAPFWASRLGKDALFARQISPRGGELWLTVKGERTLIAGEALTVIEGRCLMPGA